MANRYWVGGTGNWSSTAQWSTTSGGTSGASVPGAADVAIFDANSNTGTTNFTATVDTAFTITTLTITLVDCTVTIASAGNLTCSTSTTVSSNATTTNGVTITGNASLGAISLNSGTMNINGSTVTAISFSSNNTGTRTFNFGTNGTLKLTGNNATIWNITTSGVSTISGTGTIDCTYSGATGTRTIVNAPDTGAGLPDFKISAGTDIVTFSTTNQIDSLDFTGFSGTWTGTNLTLNGSLTLASGMTLNTPGTLTFAGTAATNTITSVGKSLGAVIINCTTGTYTLGDALNTGGSTLTLTSGTFDAATYNVTIGNYVSSGTSTRTQKLGTGTWSLSGTSWNCAVATNLTTTAGTSTISLTNTSTTARTFAGGGQTYYDLVIGGTTGTSTLTMSGSNTFNRISSTKTVAHTLTLTTGTTTTVTEWAIKGTVGNVFTLNSSTTTNATLVKSGADNAFTDYITPQYITFSPTGPNKWYIGTIVGTPTNSTGYSNGGFPLYWVGGTGTWDTTYGSTTMWSQSSGGTPTIYSPVSYSLSTANFNANSDSGSPFTVTINDASGVTCNGLSISGLDQTMTLAGSSTLSITGSISLPATNFTRTFTGNIIFNGGGNITTNGNSFANAITFSPSGGQSVLQDSFTNTSSTSLTAGTLNLGNFTLTTNTFSSTGVGTRAITRATGNITVTGNATTVLTLTGSGATYGSGVAFNCNYAGSTGTRTFNVTATTPEIDITAGTDTVVFTASNSVGPLDFTGFSGTWNNVSLTLNSTLTLSAGMTLGSGTSDVTFAGSLTLDSLGKTFNFPVTVSGASASVTLGSNLTLGATRTFTLTQGTVALGANTLSVGIFVSSTGTTVRTITRTSGNITITGNNNTVIAIGGSGISLPSSLVFDCTYAGSTGTRTIFYDSALATSFPATKISAGTDIVVASGGGITTFGALDFTGFSGTWQNTQVSITGSLTVSTGMTVGAGNGVVSFIGTGTITSNAKTFDFPVTINGSGITVTLGDALTVGSTRTTTLTQGTFSAATYNFITGLFSSSGTSTRTITMGSGTWTLSGVGTVWDLATTTGLTFNKNIANIVLSNTSTSARTFAGGGLTYNDLTIGGTTGISTTTFTGSNTFATLASTKTVAHTIRFTAGTTTTVSDWTISGTSGNVVTLTSPTAAQHTLTKSGGGTVNVSYMDISYSNATPSSTWYATDSTDSGNNTGWIFGAVGATGTFLMLLM